MHTKGFCRISSGDGESSAADCTRFPVVVGKLAGSLQDSRGSAFLNDTAAMMNGRPPADIYGGAPVNGWFWCARDALCCRGLWIVGLVCQ
jgi:hypothetical protein